MRLRPDGDVPRGAAGARAQRARRRRRLSALLGARRLGTFPAPLLSAAPLRFASPIALSDRSFRSDPIICSVSTVDCLPDTGKQEVRVREGTLIGYVAVYVPLRRSIALPLPAVLHPICHRC